MHRCLVLLIRDSYTVHIYGHVNGLHSIAPCARVVPSESKVHGIIQVWVTVCVCSWLSVKSVYCSHGVVRHTLGNGRHLLRPPRLWHMSAHVQRHWGFLDCRHSHRRCLKWKGLGGHPAHHLVNPVSLWSCCGVGVALLLHTVQQFTT